MLIATLWLVVMVAGLALSVGIAAHSLMDSSRNRVNKRVAYWHALRCWSRRRVRLEDELADNPNAIWASLDIRSASDADGCTVRAVPVGMTLDANHVPDAPMYAALSAAGVAQSDADSIVRFVQSAKLIPFTSATAISVRSAGLLHRAGIAHLFGIDTDRVDIARAPEPIALAGRLEMATASPSAATDPRTLARPPTSTMQTRGPSAWWITIEARRGDPSVTASLSVRIVLLGNRLGVQEVRTW